MKLFIWNKPYHVKYGSSCLYVLAETVEQARQQALTAGVAEYGYAPEHTTQVIIERPPDRILEAPAAEVYEWSE